MKKHDSDYEIRLATLGAMGGDTTKEYDSVYEIDLEILRLTEEGGGSAIKEVDVLPDAEENKNQIVRLSTDNKVYVAELVGTETHLYFAPENEQIGHAYLVDDGGEKIIYDGTECTLTDGTNTYIGYRWTYETGDYWQFTPKKASELGTIDKNEVLVYDGDWTEESDGVYSSAYEIGIIEATDYMEVYAVGVLKPDSQQIDNATVILDDGTSTVTATYKGTVEAVFTDGILTLGRWYDSNSDYNNYTRQSASTILNGSSVHVGAEETLELYWDAEEGKYVSTVYSVDEAKALLENSQYWVATTIENYVTGTVWEWQPINQPLQSITYDELKSLRDNSQLVPGQQYRITDYVTTTAQENTQSAGHQFDIIVTADDVNKLNENARAINHTQIVTALQFDYDGDMYVYLRYPEADEEGTYAWCGTEATDFEDILISNIDTANLIYTDTETVTIGDTYDFFDEGEDNCEITDYSNNVNIDYFRNSKLESWELKYCLDNDTNRFSWAQVGSEGFPAIQYFNIDADTTYICKRYSNGDESNLYAWATINNSDGKSINEISDWTDVNVEALIFTNTETPSVGDMTTSDYEITEYSSNAGEVPSGKGVIYYMKDEWNNQVYFDFKNINIYSEDYGDYAYLFGDNDNGNYNVDTTLDGSSNNNIVEGQVTDGVLTLDTTTLLWNRVGYQNIVKLEPTIEGSATLIYDNSMNITGISDVSFNGYTETDLLNITTAKVHMTFNSTQHTNGMDVDVTYEGNGILSKTSLELNIGGTSVKTERIVITFTDYADLSSQNQDILSLQYVQVPTPGWNAELLFGSRE